MDQSSVRSKMQEVIELVSSDIASIRTGRANPALLEDLQVTVYGGQQKLSIRELSTISTPDAQTIILEPWDKSIIGEIRKGIETANLGLTPNIDGDLIRIIIPPMTTEDREKYIKLLKGKIENGRILIRQVRGETIKAIRKLHEDKELSEDEKFDQEKKLQEITDSFIEKIEKMGKNKEQELLKI